MPLQTLFVARAGHVQRQYKDNQEGEVPGNEHCQGHWQSLKLHVRLKYMTEYTLIAMMNHTYVQGYINYDIILACERHLVF